MGAVKVNFGAARSPDRLSKKEGGSWEAALKPRRSEKQWLCQESIKKGGEKLRGGNPGEKCFLLNPGRIEESNMKNRNFNANGRGSLGGESGVQLKGRLPRGPGHVGSEQS